MFVVASCQAAVYINTNSQLPAVSTSDYWKLYQGDLPASNSVQEFNLPLLTWPYKEPPLFSTLTNAEVRIFELEVSTNAYASLYCDITCSNNFYNFLPAVTNSDGSTWTDNTYLRVIYKDTNGTPMFTNATVFTMPANAVKWDRSMLGDTNYLSSKLAVHPHIWFTPSNIPSLSDFLTYSNWMMPSWNLAAVSNQTYSFVQNTWWGNSGVTNLSASGGTLFTALAAANQTGFMYYASRSNSVWSVSNAANTLDYFCTAIIQQSWDFQDAYVFDGDGGGGVPIAEAYDWLYPFMTTGQRSNVLYTIKSICNSWMYEPANIWYLGMYPDPGSTTNRAYNGSLAWLSQSAMGSANSHPRYASAQGAALCMAVMADDPSFLKFWQFWGNYNFVKFDPYQGDEGRGYGEQSNFKFEREFVGFALENWQFPEAKLYQDPMMTNLVSFFANWEPMGYRGVFETWGSFGFFVDQWFNLRYQDYALIFTNGWVMEKFNREYSGFRLSTADQYPVDGEAFLPYYYGSGPAQSDLTDSNYFDPSRGWLMANQQPATAWGSFTNSVGFVYCARPSGSKGEHAVWNDGAFDAWAWGANLTAGGEPEGYYEHPMQMACVLMVNGIGEHNPVAPTDPYYSYFYAETNNPDFVFGASDLTKSFNRTNYPLSYDVQFNISYPFYSFASNTVPFLNSARRSVFFPHRRYYVLYDQFATSTNAQFELGWHIAEPTSVVNTNNCSFTYTCTNHFNGSNVTVYVQQIVSPSLVGLTNVADPTNALLNPFTGENYWASYGGSGVPWWNSTVWVFNKTTATNWHFLTVLFPKKWDDTNTVTINRISDNTAQVLWGGTNNDLISYGETNTSTAYTNYYIIDPGNVTTNSGGGVGPGGGGGGGSSPLVIRMRLRK